MRTLSGNSPAWIAAVAREIRGAGKPASFDFLYRVVPNQFATATNDGHVTAAENGLPRNDYRAGWKIWIEEAVAALIKAGLVAGDHDGLTWIAEQNGLWQVKFAKGTHTIYGKAESAAARDRHMLGEATEPKISKEPEAVPGYLLKGWSEAEVEVSAGIKGVIEKGRHTLQVHPFAFAIPPMTPAEQEMVRADIEKHGVLMPIVLYPDETDRTARGKPKQKALDGRHRLQFASALDKPVRVEEFKGTELEARQFVGSMNLARRHLTPLQRALALTRLYGESARKEAKAAQIRKPKETESVPLISTEQKENKSDSGEWFDRLLEQAGEAASGVTTHAIRAMDEVIKAPETAARVESGDITSIAQAKKEAAIELGKPKPASVATHTCLVCRATEPADRAGVWGDVRRGTIALHLKPGGSPFVNLSELEIPSLGMVHLECFRKLSKTERDRLGA